MSTLKLCPLGKKPRVRILKGFLNVQICKLLQLLYQLFWASFDPLEKLCRVFYRQMGPSHCETYYGPFPRWGYGAGILMLRVLYATNNNIVISSPDQKRTPFFHIWDKLGGTKTPLPSQAAAVCVILYPKKRVQLSLSFQGSPCSLKMAKGWGTTATMTVYTISPSSPLSYSITSF